MGRVDLQAHFEYPGGARNEISSIKIIVWDMLPKTTT